MAWIRLFVLQAVEPSASRAYRECYVRGDVGRVCGDCVRIRLEWAAPQRCDAKTGVVTFIQRFGSALNLIIHLHMLVPDGAWRFVNGQAHLHRAQALTDADIERLLARLIRCITRCLLRTGLLVIEGEYP